VRGREGREAEERRRARKEKGGKFEQGRRLAKAGPGVNKL